MTPSVNALGRPTKRARIDNKSKRLKKTPNHSKIIAESSASVAENQPPAVKSSSHRIQDNEPAVSLPSSFKIIAGSYEKLLYGLEGTVSQSDKDGEYHFHLKPQFIFPAHVSCIKTVAASPGGGKWLATGSSDEIIKIWDLKRRKEVGGLMHHDGSITQLSFPSRSHLLSASEDGSLCLFHARDWSVLRTMKGHKGRVNCVAVHPSGKVALSVGKDRMLRMWDLMRGKGSGSTKLGKEGEVVRWSTTGVLFAVQSMSELDIYSTKMVLLHTIKHPSRIHDIRFVSGSDAATGELLLVAAEDHKLSIYQMPMDIEERAFGGCTLVAQLVGHSNRVKAVDTLHIALPTAAEPSMASNGSRSTTIVSTTSSDGKILLYDLASLPSLAEARTPGTACVQIQPVAEYDSAETRMTCLTFAEGESAMPTQRTIQKRKLDKDTEDEEDEESQNGGVGPEFQPEEGEDADEGDDDDN